MNIPSKHSKYIALFLSCFLFAFIANAQETVKSTASDSTAVHNFARSFPSSQPPENKFKSAWGVDLLISTNGFGVGTFFRHEYSDVFSGYIDFSISEAKDDNEVEFIDVYGNTFSPGKVNRFLVLPLFVGIQKRMFKDDITDNFRPFIEAAVGPSMIYVFPYDQEYFSALGKGHPRYTVGGYLGIGSYFGSEQSNILGMNIRYYFVPYPGGIASMQGPGQSVITKNQFGGLVISLSFGTAW